MTRTESLRLMIVENFVDSWFVSRMATRPIPHARVHYSTYGSVIHITTGDDLSVSIPMFCLRKVRSLDQLQEPIFDALDAEFRVGKKGRRRIGMDEPILAPKDEARIRALLGDYDERRDGCGGHPAAEKGM